MAPRWRRDHLGEAVYGRLRQSSSATAISRRRQMPQSRAPIDSTSQTLLCNSQTEQVP